MLYTSLYVLLELGLLLVSLILHT